MRTPRPCRRCGAQALSAGRGLCKRCYDAERSAGGLTAYPRKNGDFDPMDHLQIDERIARAKAKARQFYRGTPA